MSWQTDRSQELTALLDKLTSSAIYPFDENLHRLLPDQPGLYVITLASNKEGDYLRAGRTDEGGLRQRIYQNHLMGNQKGNLRQQLVISGICNDLDDAKEWIRAHCQVQWVVVLDRSLRRWAEHYILSILRPRFCD